ncbi:MAG TPA: 5-(carboxyamino)imidazole ribonucleotide synthase [Cyanobacteria bacterium UBA11049]|nr:5-(carboxyamino)imidazole ribonucleotide synthase [Cyanobacteria bacterium UBA11049]
MERLGVIGGGQLAWMMADAAKKLGIKLVVQTPNASDPAAAIAAETIFAPVDDAKGTATLASRCDAITFENEFVDLEALSLLAQQGICFRPSLQVLSQILDKYDQRCYLQQLGLPVPKFVALPDLGEGRQKDKEGRRQGENSSSQIDLLATFPVVLKARRHGYDGQGTFIIKDLDTLEQKLAPSSQQSQHQPLFLLEEFVPFERELAVIAARSITGEIVIYPIVETQQQEQVCRRAIAPAEISPDVAAEVEAIAHTLLDSLQAVGVFGIELFLTPENKVLVNEIAPRTHNSGHFTLDACEVSQFEMHLRAVCGLPLGNPVFRPKAAVMVNLLGYEHSENDYLPQRQLIEQIPQAHVHWYGKTTSRPGRKLGHVTVLLDTESRDRAEAIAQQIESIWYQRTARG